MAPLARHQKGGEVQKGGEFTPELGWAAPRRRSEVSPFRIWRDKEKVRALVGLSDLELAVDPTQFGWVSSSVRCD